MTKIPHKGASHEPPGYVPPSRKNSASRCGIENAAGHASVNDAEGIEKEAAFSASPAGFSQDPVRLRICSFMGVQYSLIQDRGQGEKSN
jgi:hypothetical protein